MHWKEWAGYYAVCSFDMCQEREYFAFRHGAGLIDVTPLFKYEISGPDAGDFLSRVMARNIRKMRTGRVLYCCWCDEMGKVMDDGTVSRLEEDQFRVTSAQPMYAWFHQNMRGYDVCIEEVTDVLAALSLQGPTSRDILKACSDAKMDELRFFGLTQAKLDDVDVSISRTGYTGDLGYEVWVKNEEALSVWDALISAGTPYGLEPAALDAMDMTRVEAGFVLNGIDYFSAHQCLIESRKSTPYELGLGWTVKLERDYFNGQKALQKESREGSPWAFVGLELDWDEYEALFRRHGLPPQVPSGAWRGGIPVYDLNHRQIGQATSGTWSPILKKNLALASVHQPYSREGERLLIEVTVEFERQKVSATVVKTPFFDPERKKT